MRDVSGVREAGSVLVPGSILSDKSQQLLRALDPARLAVPNEEAPS